MTVKLNYKIFGHGDPIIILHGLFGSHRNWHSLAKQLAQHYRVITVDLRNHGDSDRGESMSYREMTGDIVGMLNELGLERVSLIGHSMGGKTAMVFALLHRVLMDRLVVLDIAPIDYGSRFEDLIDIMQRLSLDAITSRRQADEFLARDIPDIMLRQSLLQNLVRDNGHFRWRINLAAIKSNLAHIGGFPDLAEIAAWPGPTLFIGGGDSKYILPDSHVVIEKYFPRAEIQQLADAGHWLQLDQPGPLYERIAGFLQ